VALLQIVESFDSIQGESTFIGKPCRFVRLAGCNLRCSYCDTLYAQDPAEFKTVDSEDILKECIDSDMPIIEFTGGEPLLQLDALLPMLLRLVRHKTILIETNGSISLEPFSRAPANLNLIVDIKCPSSGMSDNICYWNLAHATRCDQFKFVVADREDFEFAKGICESHGLLQNGYNEILISPVYGAIDLPVLANWVVKEMPYARLQVQLHKIIWPVSMRGV
jgi:7-carboxy-7-deazaguanine synthase